MNGWLAIVAFFCGFVVAQLWKFVWGLISGHGKPLAANFKEAVGYLTRSGGMPSGHSASMAATTMFLGCMYGFDSGIFALAVATTAIVVYDALHVRYAVGEQGKALNELLKKAGKCELPVVEGHTMSQVVVGLILGIAVGWLFFAVSAGINNI